MHCILRVTHFNRYKQINLYKTISTILLFILFLSNLECSYRAHAIHIYHRRPTSSLQWHPCKGDVPTYVDCALLQVPLDYVHPHTGHIYVGISRLKAKHESQRIGTLFVNTGGPGSSGDDALATIDSPNNFSRRNDLSILRDHFDIIGFDTRGIGNGTQFICPSITDPYIPYPPENSQQYSQFLEYNWSSSLACKNYTGPLIEHLDTRSIVDDVDAIRQALGEKTISYYGISYGTEIGQLYAEKYPKKLRALALDGNFDHEENVWTVAEHEAATFEQGLLYLNQLCAGNFRCKLPGKSFTRGLTVALHEAAHNQITNSNGYRISTLDIQEYLRNYFYSAKPSQFYDFLVDILTKNPQKIDIYFGDFYGKSNSDNNGKYQDYKLATECQDTYENLPTFTEYEGHLAKLKALSPLMYTVPLFLYYGIQCANWAIFAQNPPSPLHIDSHLAALLIANRIDPITPLADSLALHHRILGSRLLITHAMGHGAYLNSHCGRKAIAHYLFTTRLPEQDEECQDF